MPANRQWIYRERPVDRVGPEHYELRTVDLIEELSAGEVLVTSRYLSVDPYMRIQQAARNTWEEPHPLGIVQRGSVVSQVRAVGPGAGLLSVGDWVLGYTGWQEFAKDHASAFTRLDPGAAPVSTALGVLGMPGRTAWFGLMEAGRPKPGETLVVSGAAGAVGSLVVQFGKRAGCRVIGLAGGPEKTRFLIQKLGADDAIDYRRFPDWESLHTELRRVAGAVDIYFDNVGGAITDAVIPAIARRARIVICGQISQYGGGLDTPAPGPRFLQHMLFQRATIQGVLARDFVPRMDEYVRLAAPWVRSGELVFAETFVDGFERLPEALGMLFDGANTGKLIVRCS